MQKTKREKNEKDRGTDKEERQKERDRRGNDHERIDVFFPPGGINQSIAIGAVI